MSCSSASSRSERRAQLLRDHRRCIAALDGLAVEGMTARSRRARRCRRARAASDAPESPSPIRPVRHRFCGATRSCDRICKIFFRQARTCESRPLSLSGRPRECPVCARSAQRRLTIMSRNPCAMLISRTRCENARRREAGCDRCSTPDIGGGLGRRKRSVTLRRCPPFIKWSRCFLRCAVVIGVQCISIRECTVPQLAISHG